MIQKTKFEKIGDTIFPITDMGDGIIIVDYPTYDPNLAKKITEEGRKRMKEILKKCNEFND